MRRRVDGTDLYLSGESFAGQWVIEDADGRKIDGPFRTRGEALSAAIALHRARELAERS